MNLQIVISTCTNPYWNVAVENYLLSLPATDTVTLYLWKNRRTVVIGQNQNPFSECNVALLESEGGYLMRRRTGGGAVFHDDGNLNFSFVVPHEIYDQSRQLSVIQRALENYGLVTEVSGRNDVLCQGRKFSGNAFKKSKYRHLHHGTLLIKGNIEELQRYLTVKPSKLQKHGVASVQSRVVNLSELAPVTSENVVPHLISAFEQVYGGSADVLDFDGLLSVPEVVDIYREMSSDEWKFGQWRSFVAQKSAQFPWGLVELQLDIDQEHSIIRHLGIATDSLDLGLIASAQEFFSGASSQDPPSLSSIAEDDPLLPMLRDLVSLIYC